MQLSKEYKVVIEATNEFNTNKKKKKKKEKENKK